MQYSTMFKSGLIGLHSSLFHVSVIIVILSPFFLYFEQHNISSTNEKSVFYKYHSMYIIHRYFDKDNKGNRAFGKQIHYGKFDIENTCLMKLILFSIRVIFRVLTMEGKLLANKF